MQTGIAKWFDAQDGFGVIELHAIAAILSIFVVAAAVSAAITTLATIQLGNVG